MWVCSITKTWIVGSYAEFCCKKCKQITCHSHILLLCGWYSVSIRRCSTYVDLWIQLRQLASRSVSWVEFVHFVLKKRGNQRRVSLFFHFNSGNVCASKAHWWMMGLLAFLHRAATAAQAINERLGREEKRSKKYKVWCLLTICFVLAISVW